MLGFLQENYNLVTLSIETNYKGIFEAAEKRIEYIDFLKKEHLNYFSKVVANVNDETQSEQLISMINRYDYLFQIHDSITDLFEAKKLLNENYVELKSDMLLLIRELSSETLQLFSDILESVEDKPAVDLAQTSKGLQYRIDKANKKLLLLLADPSRQDVGALANFITYSQRLKDKLINLAKQTN